MVICNAKVYPIDGDPIACGFVRVRAGKIVEVGEMSAYLPGDDEEIDAAGAYLLPGCVDAHTHIGIWEETLGLEGDDTNESSDPATPNLRAIDAINTRDPAFRTALEGGVTTVVAGPGSGNPIGGQCAALKTGGSLWIDDRIVAAPLAMKMALGENPKREYGDQDETPMTRMATAAIIRENLQKAVEYRDKLARAEDEDDEPDFDAKLDALLPLLSGEIPAHIHAHRADDIATAVRIAEEFELRYAIVHATEADLVAEPLSRLGDRFLGLITGPLFSTRTKPELSHLSFASPGLLRRHGLMTALCTDHQIVPENYLMLCAALSVKHGMTEADALASVTLSAARLSGIERRVGSITPGKDADLVLYDGHPFDIFTNVTHVWIDGVKVYEKE